MTSPVVVPDSVASFKATTTNAPIYTVNKSVAAAGDLLVVMVRSQSSTTTGLTFADGVTLATPWAANDANYRTTVIGYKYCATLTDVPASSSVALTGTAARVVITTFLVRGADKTTPVETFYPTRGGGASGATVAMAPYAATAGGLGLAFTAGEMVSPNQSAPTVEPVAPWTLIQRNATDGTTAVTRTVSDSYAAPVTAATTPSFAITYAAGSGLAAAMIVVKAATEAPPVTPGMTTTYWDGTANKTGQLYVTDAALNKSPITDMLALNQAPMTVSKWLTKRPMYSAHRGGSKNWPEHTMRAYTNAVWHGATMLEASMHCTSDGVFVLSHDATLTTTTAPNTIIKNNTWDQIKGLTQQGLPLMRLEELLDSYAKTHLLMLDDKSGANMTQLLAKLKAAFPSDYLERFLIKTYGAGGLSQLGLATAQGYRSWIFFYSDATNGDQTQLADFTTRAAQATLIGLNWDAPQASWDRAIATGKPVLAHIPDTAAKAQTGFTKGAAGVQAADVLGIIPKLNTVP